ncbi:MAG: BglII/BstYI family type II restriction endonuclease [Halobacteriota archaeon]
MKITDVRYYDGAEDKVCRLGLAALFVELQKIVLSAKVELLEEKEANSSATVRKMLDSEFERLGGWIKKTSGDVDWKKTKQINVSAIVRIGVEVQIPARSDLLIRDIVHLRNSLQSGDIDIGVIVVPNDRLSFFLPDRTPSIKDAIRYIEQEFKEAMTYPIIVVAVEHDGPGEVLPKQKRAT